jgi:hypothetical protein
MRMPLGFPPDGFESGLGYEPQQGDIFVCSYPKCGTTWLQYIVFLLVRGRPLAAGESLAAVFPHLEEVGREPLPGLEQPRLIKTHLPRALTPFSTKARYILIARNPFDCCVSFYHHTRGFPQHYDFVDGSFADFFACFLAGEVDFGDYFEHLLSWQPSLQQPNVLFVTYESLKADTPGSIRRLASFLGAPSADGVVSDATIDAIVAESSLSRMRRDQQRWSSHRPDDMPAFVRKGIVGDWRSTFTPEQARALLAQFDARLGGTGLEDLWPDILAEARLFAG